MVAVVMEEEDEEEEEEQREEKEGMRVTTTLSAHADLWLMPVTSPVTNFTPKSAALFLNAKSNCQGSNQPSFFTPNAPQLMSSTLSQGNLALSSEGDLCDSQHERTKKAHPLHIEELDPT
jgi:hypothetical protein